MTERWVFLADIKDGAMKIRNRKQLDDDLKNTDWKVARITIEKFKSKRSEQQSRYYWGAVIPIVQAALKDTGNRFSKEQTHDLLRCKFLKEDLPINDHGEFITRIKSTTELNKSDFGDYIEQIAQWSSEFLGCNIPPPSTQLELLNDNE